MDDVLRRLTDNTDARARLLAERDELIVAAALDGGLPMTRIAIAAGITRQQVYNIIKEQTKGT